MDGAGAAATATGDVLREYFRIDVTKALDPLRPRDFVLISNRIADAVRDVADPFEERAVKRALQSLDVDWKKISQAGRERIIRQADVAIASELAKGLPRIDAVFDAESGKLVTATRNASIRRYRLKIGSSLNATDRRIAEFARKSQGNFVRDEYGRRREDVSIHARTIVARGLEDGLGSDEIGAKLAKDIPQTIVARSDGYWRMLAATFVGRARTTTQLSSFDEAGIERFVIDSVLDEVTSVVCRFMHGKTFSVGKALDRFRQVEDAEDPEAIRDLQPWMSVSTDKDGKQSLYFKAGGKEVTVAGIATSGAGQRDALGTFTGGMKPADLESAGLNAPPFHGKCRTTITPEM